MTYHENAMNGKYFYERIKKATWIIPHDATCIHTCKIEVIVIVIIRSYAFPKYKIIITSSVFGHCIQWDGHYVSPATYIYISCGWFLPSHTQKYNYSL